jgi:hypothetical protein
MKNLYYLLIGFVLLNSCSIIRKSPKTEFKDGFYIQNLNNKKQIVYVNIEHETLRIHPTKTNIHHRIIDTTQVCLYYQKQMNSDYKNFTSFAKHTLDIDFLTIPLKYRPSEKGVPSQLNTNLNGAVYLGFRTDNYKVSYEPNHLGKVDRNINHYGFSMGTFSGFGNTAMTPTTTKNAISIEYDGILWTKGIAGIIAVNNFTVGLSVGFDNLLDNNNNNWIYESKPWFGLAFGLNLN